MQTARQIDSLQAGRAVAALAVVLHHANLAAKDFGGWSIPGFELGYLGVDFFFVLSGFIIYTSAQGKSLRDYGLARVRRVYLPYLPVGVGIALLYTFLPSLSDGGRNWSWLTTLTLLPLQAETALSVAWTLKHEVLFYAVFAALFFNGLLAVGLSLWGVAIVIAALFNIPGIPLSPLNLEFIAGIIAAVACSRSINSRWFYVPAICSIALWFILGADRALSPLVGLAVAFAIPPTVALERAGAIRVPPWLLLLGAASYAIYLTHGVAISIVGRLIHSPVLTLLVGLLASIVGGLAYFWLVETPLLRIMPTKRKLAVA